jgi:hypothetical protein
MLTLKTIRNACALFAGVILILTSASTSTTAPSWTTSCGSVSCHNAIRFCTAMDKSGIEEHKQCISHNYPRCGKCAHELFEAAAICYASAGSAVVYFCHFCQENTRLNADACSFVCKAHQKPTGQCVVEGSAFSCKCGSTP